MSEVKCSLCGSSFTRDSPTQKYCKTTLHIAQCEDCGEEISWYGKPNFAYHTKKSLCKGCRKTLGIKRRRETKLEKYGDENFRNIDKQQETMLKRYGAKTTLESEVLRNKKESTMKERYGSKSTKAGSNWYLNSASKRAKAQGIEIEKSLQLIRIFKNKRALETILIVVTKSGENKITYLELSKIFHNCSITELSHVFNDRYPGLKKRFIKLRSGLEEIVVNFLFEKGFVEKIDFFRRKRFTVDDKKYETDIFFPKLSIGVEVNDFATHSKDSDREKSEFRFIKDSFKKGPAKHKEKDDALETVGIKVVHIWEDDIFSGTFKEELENHINDKK